MWVKICANTNLEDAQAAVQAGVDALGFVFAPSPRQVTPAQAAAITRELPRTVERVGVFVSQDADEIAQTAAEAHLTAVQLHSHVDLDLVEQLRKQLPPEIDIIVSSAWQLGADEASAARLIADLQAVSTLPNPPLILLDAQSGASSGGLGLTFPWALAVPVLARFPALRIVLAGGLSPKNVAEAIGTLHPWGVDVASGVELRKGLKDHTKLRAFLTAARADSLRE